MERHNTRNPIQSESLEDFSDNVKNEDLRINSKEAFYVDRFGKKRITAAGQQKEFKLAQDFRTNMFQPIQDSYHELVINVERLIGSEDEAVRQAGISTAQAEISTTQAGLSDEAREESERQAGLSADSASESLRDADLAYQYKEAASLNSISVTTLEPGSVATSTLGGTPLARTLALGIPRGDKGVSLVVNSENTFNTETLMSASDLPDESYANVVDDPIVDKNGYYQKRAGIWVYLKYNPALQAKDYTDAVSLTILEQAIAYVDGSNTITRSFDASGFSEDNYYVQGSDGRAVPSPSYQATPFIVATENIEYIYSINTAGILGGAFYDEDKAFISGFGADSKPESVATVTSPTNTAFVRFSNLKTNLYPSVKAYGAFNVEKILKIVDEYSKSELLKQETLDDKLSIIGSFVNINNGNIESSPAYQRSDYIKVEGGIEYDIHAIAGSAGVAGSVWYDKDKKFISGFQPITRGVVTSPKNASFIRVSSHPVQLHRFIFKAVGDRFNIDKLMNAVNAHVSSNSASTQDSGDVTGAAVDSYKELSKVVPGAVYENAYPAGRKVYDKSLRSEVVADGAFWRMPDGSSAQAAPRTYLFPDWDEARAALPTSAVAYKSIYKSENGIANWVSASAGKPLDAYMSTEYGASRLCIEHRIGEGAKYVYLNDNSAVSLNSYLIFDFWADFNTTSGDSEVSLHAADGTVLFKQQLLKTIQGVGFNNYFGLEHVKAEIQVKKMTPAFVGASLADVKHIGFKTLSTSANRTGVGRLYVSDIETVSFRPMITLRFDDQRATVYPNAVPVINSYGFKALIAVVTGNPELANDPYRSGAKGMTKEQLLEVQDAGWELVSHTHTHTKDARTDEYLREDYRKSREYLRNELNVSVLSSSIMCTPNGRYFENVAAVQREFFDCNLNGSYNNSPMPRQPTGNWRRSSLWNAIGSFTADNNETVAPLIAAAEKAIDEERWVVFMMHEVDTTANAVTIPTNVLTEFCAWLDANRSRIDVVTVTDVVRKTRPLL